MVFSVHPHEGEFMFTGLTKHDLQTKQSWSYNFGPDRYGSEAPFAPRIGAKDEDDGYLVTFITDMAKDRSECVIIDAKRVDQGPIATILLPHRISSGTHSCWADAAAALVVLPPAPRARL
jgi:carotenoid cleavage dioxygenase